MDQLARYELPAPARYRELVARPSDWVVDSSDLMEELLQAELIRRVLEFAATRVCEWCAAGKVRGELDPETPGSYVHRTTTGLVECRAARFIDGPAESASWDSV
jgi:hypothetical protein